MKKLFSLAIVTLIAIASNAQPPNVPADKGAKFGAEVTNENTTSVENMVKLLEAKEGDKKMDVKIQGVVVEVCQAEGCWLRMKNGEGKIMVRMKDHKWFVPTVLNGKTVVLEGTAEIKVTSVDQLRHYIEDANKDKSEEELKKLLDAVKEPKKEVVIQAKGILVL